RTSSGRNRRTNPAAGRAAARARRPDRVTARAARVSPAMVRKVWARIPSRIRVRAPFKVRVRIRWSPVRAAPEPAVLTPAGIRNSRGAGTLLEDPTPERVPAGVAAAGGCAAHHDGLPDAGGIFA